MADSFFTAIKLRVKKIFYHARLQYRKLVRRCPRLLRALGGPLLGGAIGLIGGIPGVVIGLLMGYLLSKIFVQSKQDKRILEYLKNPCGQEFYEGESGLAACCALSVLVAVRNPVISSMSRIPELSSEKSGVSGPLAEKILRQVILEISCMFTGPLADPFLIEHFSRLAWSNQNSLNPYLLAESLAARRASQGDAGNFARLIYGLADGEGAKEFARYICRILDPSWTERNSSGSGYTGIQGDPWKILGLTPGTPFKEIKAHYRRLAKQFHPDELEVLDERHREAAARAFIAIKEAYKEITGE